MIDLWKEIVTENDLPPAYYFVLVSTKYKPRSIGIARKDNSKGYTVENCVTCCKTCNMIKGAIGLKEWEEWLEKIAMQWFRSKRRKPLKY